MSFACRHRLRLSVFIPLILGAVGHSGAAVASARVTSGPLPDDVITAIRLHDDGSGAGRAVTFGLPLGEGVVSSGGDLVVTTEDGTVLESQWNPLASWRTDGSVLHGAMTFLTPSSSSNDGIYYVKEGASVSGTEINSADIVGSGFEAKVQVQIGGASFSLSASDLLDGTVEPRLEYTQFTGPLASELVVGGPLRVDGSGSQHATLQAYFYVRAFGQPVDNVYVTVVLENTGAFKTLSTIVADDVDVRVGGSSLPGFPKSDFSVYADVRYPRRAWWNGSNELWVQHDMAYVSETKLMPKYRAVTMDTSVLESFAQSSEWNERRILSSANLEGGGAKRELAPYDSWTAAYMVSGDRRAWNAMRTALDEYSMMVSKFGSGVVHARDEETGLPLDLTTKGVISQVWGTAGGTDVLSAHKDGTAIAQTDSSHWPSIGYLPYLLTAETNELENVQHSAVQAWLNEGPGGRKGTIPSREIRSGQTRSMAWTLREIIAGAVATPDHHPLREALQTSATHALNEYSDAGQPEDPQGEIGLWYFGNLAFPYDDRTGVAPWMDDFLSWAVGDAYERGWRRELDETGFWAWKAQGVVGRFGTDIENGFCWEYASAYKLEARPTKDSPLYASWADLFAANHPEVESCATSPGTGDIGSDLSATSYGAQVAGGLATAVSTGRSGAAAAWELYEEREKTWNVAFEERPEWAILPRFESGERPSPPSDLAVD